MVSGTHYLNSILSKNQPKVQSKTFMQRFSGWLLWLVLMFVMFMVFFSMITSIDRTRERIADRRDRTIYEYGVLYTLHALKLEQGYTASSNVLWYVDANYPSNHIQELPRP